MKVEELERISEGGHSSLPKPTLAFALLTSTGSLIDLLKALGVHCLEILTLTLLKVFLDAWSNE